AGKKFEELYPWARGLELPALEPSDWEQVSQKAQFIFLAMPDGEALKAAPLCLERGLKVVDLSGDFRLKDPIQYEKWYKLPQTAPQLLAQAVYGLPELNRKAISEAKLVANPGCYATSVLLALLPLAAGNLVDLDTVIVDAKSGTSGAKRKLAQNLHFS